MLKRLGGVVIAIVIGLGFWGFQTWKAKSDAPDVGQCVIASGNASDANVEKADCGQEGVIYKVTADDGNCDDAEVSYTVEVKSSDAVNLCLALDVKAGECLKPDAGGVLAASVSCATKSTAADPVVKVAAVKDSATAKCGKKQVAEPNTKRNVTICYANNV